MLKAVMINELISKGTAAFKNIDGDPDYVARGLAIGVFVGITPTIPFQTALAVALAALCRGSKPAAVLGIWSGNPVTMPLLYAGSYKLGMLILGKPAAAFSLQQQSLMEFFKSGANICCATIAAMLAVELSQSDQSEQRQAHISMPAAKKGRGALRPPRGGVVLKRAASAYS